MDDGTEFIAGPGDVTSLPSGHDAWVVGDEPVVVVDWYGASNYAKGDGLRNVSTTARVEPAAGGRAQELLDPAGH